MVDIKKEIEQYFEDNWTETELQMQTDDFPNPNNNRRISLVFIPIDRRVYAMDGNNGRKMDTAQLKISSYDTSATLSMELEDMVRQFIECYELTASDSRVGEGVPDGMGVVDLGNGVYESTSLFIVQTYR